MCVHLFQGHPFARAQLRIFTFFDRGGSCARSFVLGAPIGARTLEDLEVPVLGSCCARQIVPGVPPTPRPRKDLEVLVFYNSFAKALKVGLESPQPRVL